MVGFHTQSFKTKIKTLTIKSPKEGCSIARTKHLWLYLNQIVSHYNTTFKTATANGRHKIGLQNV